MVLAFKWGLMGSYVKLGICLPVGSCLLLIKLLLEGAGQCLEMPPRALAVFLSLFGSCTRVWGESKGIGGRLPKCLTGLKYCPRLVHAVEAPSVLLSPLLTESGNCIAL